MCPAAIQEEGSEIELDLETIAPAAGWTDNAGSGVVRNGRLVTVALHVKNAAKAAALICTLPPEYRPAEALKNAVGTLEVLANGECKSLDGSTSLESATSRIYEVSYIAGNVEP